MFCHFDIKSNPKYTEYKAVKHNAQIFNRVNGLLTKSNKAVVITINGKVVVTMELKL